MRRHASAAIALLVALSVVGSPAAKPPPGKTPPGRGQGQGGPGQKKPKPGARSDWLIAADAACTRGSLDRQAALAAVRGHPSPTARQTLLRILSGTTRAEGPMLGDLRSIRPPRSARAGFARALALFRARKAADERLVAKLRKRWDAQLLERQLALDRGTNDRVAALWQSLGATTCAQYFAGLGA